MKADSLSNSRRYLGIDVGGTKLQASLIEESGRILDRQRASTPRQADPDQVVAAIEQLMDDLLDSNGMDARELVAIGVAVPGVVDPKTGLVVVTPNMSLSGVPLGPRLQRRFRVPVVLGNDCNLGALGEKWLGSAREARSLVAILVGTGIGGGFVRSGKLWRGAREAAAEVGHIVMQIGGPKCGCGNLGCLEALASRSAIEREIRQAVAAGRPSVLTSLCSGDLSVIRSRMLRRALAMQDELAVEIMRRASEVIGHACLTVRHLVDPEVIVLGGGVIEACHDFMMPIIEAVVASDQLPGARDSGRVLLSALGDDAVVLGAVALARKAVRRSPFRKRFTSSPRYPRLAWQSSGEVGVGRKTYNQDIYISVDGKPRKRDKSLAQMLYDSSHILGPVELQEVCQGGPEILFIGAGQQGRVEVSEEGRRYLALRSIHIEVLPTARAIEAYNKSKQRKAALIHVTC